MKTNILGVPVDSVTAAQALECLLRFMGEDGNHILLTPNPEMVMAAQDDEQFMRIFREADLVVPDGIGVVLASRLNRVKIKERVAGCDLIQALFAKLSEGDVPCSVYLLGGKPGVCELAKANIENSYKQIRVAGFFHGYFDGDQEREIIADIQNKKPDILLVGLGFPRQEKWINTHRGELPVRLSAGVGGTLDVLAGTVKRAPGIFRSLGLEWLYRLAKQPKRAGRMLQLPVFAWKVVWARGNTRQEDEQ